MSRQQMPYFADKWFHSSSEPILHHTIRECSGVHVLHITGAARERRPHPLSQVMAGHPSVA